MGIVFAASMQFLQKKLAACPARGLHVSAAFPSEIGGGEGGAEAAERGGGPPRPRPLDWPAGTTGQGRGRGG